MSPGPPRILVLAGHRDHDDPLARYAGVAHKGLIPVDGEPMLDRVIGTLRSLPNEPQIALALDPPSLLEKLPAVQATLNSGQLQLVPTAGSPSRTVLTTLRQNRLALPFLLTTADHPLLTPEMIGYFWEHVSAGPDMVAAVASATALANLWPATRRTRLRFSDDAYGGCNLFAVMTPRAEGAIAFWQRAEARRKRPAALIRLLGVATTAQFLLGRLSLAEMVRRLERRTGTRLAAICLPFPEAAIDVDKPDDLFLAERILRMRRQMSAAPPVTADTAL